MERFSLHSDCSDLKKPLDMASDAARAQVAWAVAQWAIRHNNLAHVALAAARPSDPPEAVSAIVKQLDDLYFDLGEEPEASDTQVQAAFRRARAANALEYAMQGNAYEAIYEARASTDDIDALHQVVLQTLAQSR
jgi:hypothetical protein